MLKDHFPFKSAPYPHQVKVFSAIESSRKEQPDKKFVLLRGPTGCGKSAIAITLALEAASLGKSTHILASHRFLQTQYLSDFEQFGLRNLWGKRNYPCRLAATQGFTLYGKDIDCGDCVAYRRDLSRKISKLVGKDFIAAHCSSKEPGDLCHYTKARSSASVSKIALTNYNSFLAHTFYTETLGKRDLLIVDEAHLLADRLAGFLTTEVPLLDEWVEGHSESKNPKDHLEWLNTVVKSQLVASVEGMARALNNGISIDIDDMFNILVEANPMYAEVQASLPTNKDSEEMDFVRLYQLYKKIDKLLETATQNPNYWVVDIVDKTIPGSGVEKVLEYKPVKVGKLAESYLFKYADEVVLMSATMNTGPFLSDLGIDADDIKAFIDLPSVFPISTRPIINDPVGSMSMATKEETIKLIAKKIEDIVMNKHPSEKGVIHLHSFKNGADLHRLLPLKVRSKIIWHLGNDGLRIEELADLFFKSKDRWLASPSIVEGLDGKDDRVRAQILIKAPYPNIGSAQVAARKDLSDGQEWYLAQAANSLVQAYGRGTRHANDYSVMYVLDSEVSKAVAKANKSIPKWFMDAWVLSNPSNWKVVDGRYVRNQA
jgi:ATP-dependent DNA helicase DinG